MLENCPIKSFFSKLFSKKTCAVALFSEEDTPILKTLDPHIVVGKILTIRPHSNATMTKVRVTTCDLGDGTPTQVLCGGVNIEVGQIVPVAKVGAKLSADFEIGVREIKGEASHGMICARSELGLSAQNEKKGEIWVLPATMESCIGKSLSIL